MGEILATKRMESGQKDKLMKCKSREQKTYNNFRTQMIRSMIIFYMVHKQGDK